MVVVPDLAETLWISSPKGPIVIEAGIGAALRLDLRRILGKLPRQHRRAVHDGDDRIDRAGLADLGPLEGLNQRLRQGQTTGLDQDMVDAIAPLAREGKVELGIVGDGPEMPALVAQVEREGISGSVEFTGWLKHDELPRRLVNYHVFGFPSVKEFGGAVVLESMSLGLVPVVVDYGGPGELVSPTTGFAVPIGTRNEIVSRFRDVFERLIANTVLTVNSSRRLWPRPCLRREPQTKRVALVAFKFKPADDAHTGVVCRQPNP